MKTRQFKSEFDSNLQVVVLGKEDFRYEIMKPLFNEYGFGFIIPGLSLVMIDGEQRLGKSVEKFIEAHEVAHIMLNHSESKNPTDEIHADMVAWDLLTKSGYSKSADLVIEKFEERHGIKFDKKILENIRKY
jgi:hypothetical protein